MNHCGFLLLRNGNFGTYYDFSVSVHHQCELVDRIKLHVLSIIIQKSKLGTSEHV